MKYFLVLVTLATMAQLSHAQNINNSTTTTRYDEVSGIITSRILNTPLDHLYDGNTQSGDISFGNVDRGSVLFNIPTPAISASAVSVQADTRDAAPQILAALDIITKSNMGQSICSQIVGTDPCTVANLKRHNITISMEPQGASVYNAGATSWDITNHTFNSAEIFLNPTVLNNAPDAMAVTLLHEMQHAAIDKQYPLTIETPEAFKTNTVPHEIAAQYPGSEGYAVTFRCDSTYDIRSLLEAATFDTFDDSTSTGDYNIGGVDSVIDMKLLNKLNQPIREYKLYGAYVRTIGDSAYNIGDAGSIVTVQTTLAYHFWRSFDIAATA